MNKSLVQQQFGAHAAAYVTSSVHAKGASLGRLVELVRPQPTWQALDVATGAGHTAAAFAPHVGRVIASDLTEEMLQEAAKLAKAKGLANMETARADAEALPFEDARFDLVTCRIAPHHFPDIPSFVAEVCRSLKAGGTFALVDNIAPDAESTPGFSSAELRDAALTYNAFEKIRDPIYGGLTTTVNVGDTPRWVTQDVGMWLGHTAYLEIADGAVADYRGATTGRHEGLGYVAVDEIRMSNQRTPSPIAAPAQAVAVQGAGLLRPAPAFHEAIQIGGYAGSVHRAHQTPGDGQEGIAHRLRFQPAYVHPM